MGYNTDFYGSFELDKPLTDELYDLLVKLNKTRRMKRDLTKLFPNMTKEEVEKKWGVDGEFYVDSTDDYGQTRDASIIDYNLPPSTQPGLWCQWVPTEDKMGIEWDGGEKAYNMVEWIEYIIQKILSPNGYILSGEVEAVGEEMDDRYRIVIEDNVVYRQTGHWVWDD